MIVECKAQKSGHWYRHEQGEDCVQPVGLEVLFEELDRLRKWRRDRQDSEASLMAQLARFFPDRPPATVGLGIDRLIALAAVKDAEILKVREERDSARFDLKVLEDRVRLVRGMLGENEEN